MLGTVLAFGIVHAFVEIETPQSALRFLKENVYGLLRQGDFPEYFGLDADTLEDLECKFAPKKLKWGRQVGYFCVRTNNAAAVPDYKNFAQCTDMFNVEIAVICPDDWEASCPEGCVIPRMRRTQAIDFWELAITDIIKTGYDYSVPSHEFIKKCGCKSDNVQLIEYGSGVGFDCILKPDWRDIFTREECWNGHHYCKHTDTQEDLLTFCPIGYIPTCNGCLPGVPGLVVDSEGNIDDSGVATATQTQQLSWLVEILAGYARQSQKFIGWMPGPARALACACKTAMKPVEYGMNIGYYCEVWDDHTINHEICRHSEICMDPSGNKVLHMCPDGFITNCETGCTLPWKWRDDL